MIENKIFIFLPAVKWTSIKIELRIKSDKLFKQNINRCITFEICTLYYHKTAFRCLLLMYQPFYPSLNFLLKIQLSSQNNDSSSFKSQNKIRKIRDLCFEKEPNISNFSYWTKSTNTSDAWPTMQVDCHSFSVPSFSLYLKDEGI